MRLKLTSAQESAQCFVWSVQGAFVESGIRKIIFQGFVFLFIWTASPCSPLFPMPTFHCFIVLGHPRLCRQGIKTQWNEKQPIVSFSLSSSWKCSRFPKNNKIRELWRLAKTHWEGRGTSQKTVQILPNCLEPAACNRGKGRSKVHCGSCSWTMLSKSTGRQKS